jgi:hypothetical protein
MEKPSRLNSVELGLEVLLFSNRSLFGSGSFLAGAGALALASFLSRSFFALTLALTLAFAGAFALTLASALAVTLAVAALAGAQQLLCPSNNLVTVGGDYVNDTGNSGQSSQNLNDGINSFHRDNLHLYLFYATFSITKSL